MENLINYRLYKKTMAFFSLFSLFIQTFLPFTYFDIKSTFAADLEPTPIVEQTPTPVPPEPVQEPTSIPVEPTAVPAAEPTVEPTSAPTEAPIETPVPTLEPTLEPTAVPTVEPIPTVVAIDITSSPLPPTITPTVEPVEVPTPAEEPTFVPVIEQICLDSENYVDSADTDWNIDLESSTAETKVAVQPGIRYTFPQEKKVSVVFTCVPVNEIQRSTLKIQQLKVTDLNLPEGTNVYGDYAYDITTNMTDGDFKYDITLPKPEDSIVKVSYMENVGGEIKTVDQSQTEQGNETVKVSDVDHFTVYFVEGHKDKVHVTATPSPTPTTLVFAANPSSVSSVTGSCMGDLDSNLTCSANDVSLANVTGIEILDDGCQYPGDNVTFKATWEVKSTATQRYDIGLWFATGGQSSALTGTCSASTLANSPVPPWYDFDQDACGDLSSSGPVHPEITITVKCLDSDGDNNLNLPYCTSWQQNSGNVCSSPIETLPGAPSKCNCENGFEVPITVPHSAQIEVVKNLVPSTDPGRFNLQVDSVNKKENAGDTDTTGKITVSAGTNVNPGADHTVGEIAYTGTNLADYQSSINCVKRGDSTIVASSSNAGPLTVHANKDDDIVCTITNSLNQATLTLVKTVVNDDGGTATVTDFTPYIGTDAVAWDVPQSLNTGSYKVSESTLSGYTASDWGGDCSSDGSITLSPGQKATCTVTNNDQAGKLIVKKEVKNDNGGTKTCEDFSFSYSPTHSSSFEPDCQNEISLPAGAYTVTEPSVSGYATTYDNCSDILVANGETETCTITNDDIAPHLIVIKHVDNTNGGNAVSSDFTMTINGITAIGGNSFPGAENPGTDKIVLPGSYTVTEAGPDGYQSNFSADCSGTIALGQTKTCTVTNDDKPATLIVKKHVINDNGGIAVAGDFTINVTGTNVSDNSFPGSESGTSITLDAGSYSVDESSFSGYTKTIGLNCSGTIKIGETKTCTITNDDDPGAIYGMKFEDIDGDGLKDVNEPGLEGWTINLQNGITAVTDAQGKYSFSGLSVGKYMVTESNPADSGWTQTTQNPPEIDITNGTIVENINFGNFENIDITACKYVDENQDGDIEYDKLYDGGWNFYLDGGSLQNTGKGGCVTWSNLGPGTYTVSEDTSNQSWTQTYPVSGDHVVNALSGENKTVNFGNYQKGELKVCKYTDYTGNGNYEEGQDTPLSNINFQLYFSDDSWEYKTSLETGADGCATFTNLKAGSYKVAEDYDDSDLDDYYSTNGITHYDDVEISSGSKETRIFLNAKYRSISGMKFNDSNGDGVKDVSEPGLSDWVIFIDSNGNNILDAGEVSAITDINGEYSFKNLVSDSYRVAEQIKSGWTQTLPTLGYYDVDLHINISSVGNDFGNVQLSNIHGYKWDDQNGNGLEDVGEPRLSGWEIFIDKNNDSVWNQGEPKTITSSDSNPDHFGWYWFEDLLPGIYKVCETNQNGWTQTYPDPNCHTISLPYNNEQLDAAVVNFISNPAPAYNFGNLNKGKVVVIKYHDLNANGVRDDGEPTLPGWNIILGTQSSQTDASGQANFEAVAGSYDLSETILPGWYQSDITCEDTGEGVLITGQGEAYGHHGACQGWNNCGDAATCALWACEVNGFSQLVSYGESRPCTQFNNCHLFNYRGSVQMNWGNWCDVMGVTDIKCSNSTSPTATPTPRDIGFSWLVKPVNAQLSTPTNSKSITVQAGSIKTCHIGNYQKATITVNKDVLTYLGEEVDDNFSFNLSAQGLGSTVTFSENSPAVFTVNPGSYQFSEIDIDSRYVLKSQNNVGITVQSGDSKSVTFENWKVQPRLTIAKYNNSWPTNQSHRSQVTYNIVINILDNDLRDVTVVDLPPYGFKYLTGSYQAMVNGSALSIAEPIYASPGKWYLGDLKKGDEVVLTYTAVIGDNVKPGLYKDLAYAYGCRDTEDCQIGSSDKITAQSVDSGKLDPGVMSDTFVGTKVALATNPEDPRDVDIENEVGQVLGATTELPSTGAETIWLLISALLSAVGLSLILFKKKMTKIFSIFIFALVVLSPSSVRAAQSENIFIRLEEPKTPTNVNRFTIDFVAMDQLNRALTVKCYVVKHDASVFQLDGDISLSAGGTSGQCTMENFNLSENGHTYEFYAVASNGGEEYKSNSAFVLYDVSAPDSVHNFGKEKINSCQYKIMFKAADDGQTIKVIIYRSDKTEFTADNSTKVGEVGISPGQEGSYTDIISGDCNKTYYYVVRAFDDSGNGSGVVGDDVTVHVGSVEGDSTSSQGAIPVTGVYLAGEDDPDSSSDTDTTSGDNGDSQTSEGSILGEKEATSAAQAKSRWAIISVVIGLLIIGYGLKKRAEK